MGANQDLCLLGWLKQINDSIVPPLCVEIFLIDGTSYFLNSVAYWDENDSTVVIRIWDFREMSGKDIEKLKSDMVNVKDRKEYAEPSKIHSKLDSANLRIPKERIAYIMEWHDRLWQEVKIGFENKGDNK